MNDSHLDPETEVAKSKEQLYNLYDGKLAMPSRSSVSNRQPIRPQYVLDLISEKEESKLQKLEGEVRKNLESDYKVLLKIKERLESKEEDLKDRQGIIRRCEELRDELLKREEKIIEKEDELFHAGKQMSENLRKEEAQQQIIESKIKDNEKQRDCLREISKRLDDREGKIGTLEKDVRLLEKKKKNLELSLKKIEADLLKHPINKIKQQINKEKEKLNAAELREEGLKAELNQLVKEHRLLELRYQRESGDLETSKNEVESLKMKIKSIKRVNKGESSELKHLRKVSELKSGLFSSTKKIGALQIQLLPAVQFGDMEIIHAIASMPRQSFKPPVDIAVVGEGPFEDKQFCNLLRKFKYKTWNKQCECLIIGHNNWNEQQLEDAICDENLDEIRVYSQELFILGMITGKDPFALPDDLLIRFAVGHPGLDLLVKNGFEWPAIEAFENLNEEKIQINASRFADESPLADASINYHVGESGIHDKNNRHIKLEKAFLNPLKYTSQNEPYIKQWGAPNSRRRLWRMANHLSWCVDFLGARDSMNTSVEHWLTDLEWLKERYYSRFMRFRWPR